MKNCIVGMLITCPIGGWLLKLSIEVELVINEGLKHSLIHYTCTLRYFVQVMCESS